MIYETEEEIYIELKVMSEDLELETFKRNSCPYPVEDEEWCEEDLQKNPIPIWSISTTFYTISKTPHLMIYTRYKANMRAS